MSSTTKPAMTRPQRIGLLRITAGLLLLDPQQKDRAAPIPAWPAVTRGAVQSGLPDRLRLGVEFVSVALVERIRPPRPVPEHETPSVDRIHSPNRCDAPWLASAARCHRRPRCALIHCSP